MNPYSRQSLHTYTTTRGQIREAGDWLRFLRWEAKQREQSKAKQEDIDNSDAVEQPTQGVLPLAGGE